MKENNIPTDALESGRRRILIVDDDQAVVDLITEVLANDGRFEIKVVNNGFAAGMLAKEYHPDLIILDVMLPDINGQAVCELIRNDPTMADIKIICISGMVEEDKIADLHKSGADDFLHKPLDIDELIRRICRLLDIETGRDRLSESRPGAEDRGHRAASGSPPTSSVDGPPTGRSPDRCTPISVVPFPAVDFRRRVERLDRLPLRPTSARSFLQAFAAETADAPSGDPRSARSPADVDADPGWVLAQAVTGGAVRPALPDRRLRLVVRHVG